jgi:transposase
MRQRVSAISGARNRLPEMRDAYWAMNTSMARVLIGFGCSFIRRTSKPLLDTGFVIFGACTQAPSMERSDSTIILHRRNCVATYGLVAEDSLGFLKFASANRPPGRAFIQQPCRNCSSLWSTVSHVRPRTSDQRLSCTGATDMRKGFDGLYGLVRDRLLCEPMSGHLFLFCNARRNRLKILYWDSTGLWICAKRLERGRFSWPTVSSEDETNVLLSHEELALLVGGIDLSRARRKEWYRREEAGR